MSVDRCIWKGPECTKGGELTHLFLLGNADEGEEQVEHAACKNHGEGLKKAIAMGVVVVKNRAVLVHEKGVDPPHEHDVVDAAEYEEKVAAAAVAPSEPDDSEEPSEEVSHADDSEDEPHGAD